MHDITQRWCFCLLSESRNGATCDLITRTFVPVWIKAQRTGQRFTFFFCIVIIFCETSGFQLLLSLIECNHILFLYSCSCLKAVTACFFFYEDTVPMLKLKSLSAWSWILKPYCKEELAFTLVPSGHLTLFILIQLLCTLLVMPNASWCRLISSYRCA